MIATRDRADRSAAAAVTLLMALLALSDGAAPTSSDAGHSLGAVSLLALAAGAAAATWRAPAAGAVATLALTMAWYQVGYSGSLINVPYLVAFYLLGTSGDRLRQGLVGGAAVALAGAATLATSSPAIEAVTAVGWTVAALVIGELHHSRAVLRAELESRAVRAEQEMEREAGRQVAEARLQIARDLHDVLSHTVSAMTVQAAAGRDALGRDPAQVELALHRIHETGRQAMSEVQALVTVLRDPSQRPPLTPAPAVGDLDGLLDTARAAGLSVISRTRLDDARLTDVDRLTAYRIVQESLTNVVRHASANQVTVTVLVAGDSLDVIVEDDGTASSGAPAGFGIRGMRERVHALGGDITAGPTVGGGWRVRARLPLTGPPCG